MSPYVEPESTDARFAILVALAERTVAQADELRGLVRQLGQARCLAIARENRIEALAGVALGEVLPAGERSEEWSLLVEKNAKRVDGLIASVGEIFEAFERQGVRAAVIEGGGMLLGTAYPLVAYGAGDVDLLVERVRWDDAREILGKLGFRAIDRRGRPTTRIEYRREFGSGAEQFIEVGHRPFDRMWLPLGFADRSQEWLHARVPAQKVRGAFVLAATNALVLCATHASMHSYVRSPAMRLQIDIDRVARQGPIDWSRFADEVLLSGVRTRAFVALALASGLLGTPVPESLLQQLAPRNRWPCIRRLIEGEGVVVSKGRPKLSRHRAVVLDVLLDDRGFRRWLQSLVFPDARWMREHFDREQTKAALWRLHQRRFRRLVKRWRPE